MLILVVVFGLGWGAAFGAGTVYGRTQGGPSGVVVVSPSGGGSTGFGALGAGAGASVASPTGGGSGAGASGGGRSGTRQPADEGARDAAARRGTLGVVQQVGDDRLTLRAASGTVTVLLRPATVFQKAVEGTRADVREGMAVLVNGQRGSNGELEAASILVLPADAAGADGRPSEPSRP